jgi:hypothetical protein
MAHEVIPIERIKREAHQAAKQHANANSANPYPTGSSASLLFKEHFFIAREQRAQGVAA